MINVFGTLVNTERTVSSKDQIKRNIYACLDNGEENHRRIERCRSASSSLPLSSSPTTTTLPKVAVPQTDSVNMVQQHCQKNWQEVKMVLSQKTIELERTMPMIQEITSDEHITVWLPKSPYYIQHCHTVLAALQTSHRFKVGITVDPDWRYHLAHYAYTKHRTQERDHVKYQGMIVVFLHNSREVVAMMEHALISECLRAYASRCANRKIDYDNHIQDESDSENEQSPRPFALYICYGQRM